MAEIGAWVHMRRMAQKMFEVLIERDKESCCRMKIDYH